MTLEDAAGVFGVDLDEVKAELERQPERKELMAKVWRDTPWMVDAYTGSHDTDRRHDLMEWCREQFGPEAWPIHGHPGQWHSGGATVDGWTWMGFATEEQMRRFTERWPAPNVRAKRETPHDQ